MLEHIELRRFKSFWDQGIDLAPLTMLVGPNAAGKSNLLEAIQLINALARGRSLADFFGANGDKACRGDLLDLFFGDQSVLAIQTRWHNGGPTAEHRIEINREPGEFLFREDVSDGKDSMGFEASSEHSVPPLYAWLHLDPEHMRTADSEPRIHHDYFDILESTLAGEIHLIAPNARATRGYVSKRNQRLGQNGQNLSAVIWSLCQKEEEREDLLDWLRELCAPELASLDFMETERDVMLVLVERDGTRLPADCLSDGTLRFLCLLAAVRTAPEGSMLLIEELESGLHPQRIHLLIQLLENLALDRGVQVLATTHSPATLAELPPEHLGNTVVFGRIPEEKGTVMRRLKDLPHFEEIVKKKGIEDLFRTGWLEHAL